MPGGLIPAAVKLVQDVQPGQRETHGQRDDAGMVE